MTEQPDEVWEELQPEDEFYDTIIDIRDSGVKIKFTHKMAEDYRWHRCTVSDGEYQTRMNINIGLMKINRDNMMDMVQKLFKENKEEAHESR